MDFVQDPWLQNLQELEQNGQLLEFQDDPPEDQRDIHQDRAGDFVFHQEENFIQHEEIPPQHQLQPPPPIFRSSFRSGSCPFPREDEYETSMSISVNCEGCRSNYIIIRQNNRDEVELTVAEFYRMYDCIIDYFGNRH